MLEGMTRQRGMVHLNIQFEILIQTVLTEKSDHSSSIVIILMFGGLAGFGFDKEYPFETLTACIITRHGQKTTQMIQLTPHISIQQGHITFTPAPEYIILSSQCNGGIEGIFYLCTGIGQSGKIRIGRSPVHITWIRKHVSRTP